VDVGCWVLGAAGVGADAGGKLLFAKSKLEPKEHSQRTEPNRRKTEKICRQQGENRTNRYADEGRGKTVDTKEGANFLKSRSLPVAYMRPTTCTKHRHCDNFNLSFFSRFYAVMAVGSGSTHA
jgi:hypothetical protein